MLSICVSRYYWLSGFTVDIPTGIAVHHYIRVFGVMMCSFFYFKKEGVDYGYKSSEWYRESSYQYD